MATKPSKEILNAKDIDLTTLDILNVTINEMNDPQLMQALVDAGLAEYVEESKE